MLSTFPIAASTEKIATIVSCISDIISGSTGIYDTINSSVTLDDYEISICLHRKGSGGLAKQSHGIFVVSSEGAVKWHQYVEYGNQRKENVLEK